MEEENLVIINNEWSPDSFWSFQLVGLKKNNMKILGRMKEKKTSDEGFETTYQ